MKRADEGSKPSGPRLKNVDNTFGICTRGGEQLQMGNRLVEMSDDGKLITVDENTRPG